ncbi:MAG: hypothetical protein HWN67_11850 [Candidatus Helarchaeota archaeon]|nr:hypothetical protein [Candidatus Helarchaeota archaeon]
MIKIVDSNIDYYFYDFYELLESVKPEILNVYLSDNNRLNKVEVDWNDLEEVLYFIEIVKKHNPAYLKEKKLIERLETSILNDKFDINQIHLLSHIEWFLKRIDTILGKDIGQKLFEKIKSYRKQLILKKIYLKEPEKDIVGHGRTFVDNFLRRLEFTHNQYPGVAISELIDYKEIRKITEIEESVLHLLKFIRFFNKNILDSRDKLINFETIKKRINDLIHEVFQLKELNQLHQINLWIVVDEGYISDCFKAIYELYKEEFEKFHFWNTIKSEFNFDFNFGRFYKIVYTLYEIKPDILVPFINIKDLKKYILKHQIEVFALGINYLNLFSEIYKLEDSEIAAEFEKFTENFKLLKK